MYLHARKTRSWASQIFHHSNAKLAHTHADTDLNAHTYLYFYIYRYICVYIYCTACNQAMPIVGIKY